MVEFLVYATYAALVALLYIFAAAIIIALIALWYNYKSQKR